MSTNTPLILSVDSLCMRRCINKALGLEANHALAGLEDCEGGSIDEAPSSVHISSSTSSSSTSDTHPSNGEGAYNAHFQTRNQLAKFRRQKTCFQVKLNLKGHPQFSYWKNKPRLAISHAPYSAKKLPAAKGAFVSQNQSGMEARMWSLHELMEHGHRLVKWDGW